MGCNARIGDQPLGARKSRKAVGKATFRSQSEFDECLGDNALIDRPYKIVRPKHNGRYCILEEHI
jgi:hypothetical protein